MSYHVTKESLTGTVRVQVFDLLFPFQKIKVNENIFPPQKSFNFCIIFYSFTILFIFVKQSRQRFHNSVLYSLILWSILLNYLSQSSFHFMMNLYENVLRKTSMCKRWKKSLLLKGIKSTWTNLPWSKLNKGTCNAWIKGQLY